MAGVELWRSFAAASAVVERRQASALRSARAAPKRGSWTTRLPAFRLPSFFCFFLALRAWIGMKGRTPPPASHRDRSKADASCRFRAACRRPRMPTASRERWRSAFRPTLSHGAAAVRIALTDSPLCPGKASVLGRKHDNLPPCHDRVSSARALSWPFWSWLFCSLLPRGPRTGCDRRSAASSRLPTP